MPARSSPCPSWSFSSCGSPPPSDDEDDGTAASTPPVPPAGAEDEGGSETDIWSGVGTGLDYSHSEASDGEEATSSVRGALESHGRVRRGKRFGGGGLKSTKNRGDDAIASSSGTSFGRSCASTSRGGRGDWTVGSNGGSRSESTPSPSPSTSTSDSTLSSTPSPPPPPPPRSDVRRDRRAKTAAHFAPMDGELDTSFDDDDRNLRVGDTTPAATKKKDMNNENSSAVTNDDASSLSSPALRKTTTRKSLGHSSYRPGRRRCVTSFSSFSTTTSSSTSFSSSTSTSASSSISFPHRRNHPPPSPITTVESSLAASTCTFSSTTSAGGDSVGDADSLGGLRQRDDGGRFMHRWPHGPRERTPVPRRGGETPVRPLPDDGGAGTVTDTGGDRDRDRGGRGAVAGYGQRDLSSSRRGSADIEGRRVGDAGDYFSNSGRPNRTSTCDEYHDGSAPPQRRGPPPSQRRPHGQRHDVTHHDGASGSDVKTSSPLPSTSTDRCARNGTDDSKAQSYANLKRTLELEGRVWTLTDEARRRDGELNAARRRIRQLEEKKLEEEEESKHGGWSSSASGVGGGGGSNNKDDIGNESGGRSDDNNTCGGNVTISTYGAEVEAAAVAARAGEEQKIILPSTSQSGVGNVYQQKNGHVEVFEDGGRHQVRGQQARIAPENRAANVAGVTAKDFVDMAGNGAESVRTIASTGRTHGGDEMDNGNEFDQRGGGEGTKALRNLVNGFSPSSLPLPPPPLDEGDEKRRHPFVGWDEGGGEKEEKDRPNSPSAKRQYKGRVPIMSRCSNKSIVSHASDEMMPEARIMSKKGWQQGAPQRNGGAAAVCNPRGPTQTSPCGEDQMATANEHEQEEGVANVCELDKTAAPSCRSTNPNNKENDCTQPHQHQNYHQQLVEKIKQLEHALATQQQTAKRDAERRIHALKKKHERIQHSLELQIARLKRTEKKQNDPCALHPCGERKDSVEATPLPSNELKTAARKTVRIAEKTSANHIRSYYQRKLSELQKKHEVELCRARQQNEGGGSMLSGPNDAKENTNKALSSCSTDKTIIENPIAAKVGDVRKDNDRVAELEKLVAKQRDMIAQLGQGSSTTNDALSEGIELRCSEAERQVYELRTKLSQVTSETKHQRDDGGRSRGEEHVLELTKQIKTLEAEKASNQGLVSSLQDEVSHAYATIAKVKRDADQTHPLDYSLLKIQSLQTGAEASQVKHIMLQNQVDSLMAENNALKVQVPSAITVNPIVEKYAHLSRRIEEMERRSSIREDKLKLAVREAQETSRTETKKLQTLHEDEMREKDEQIRGFRERLAQLMKRVEQMALAQEESSIQAI